MTLPPGIGQVKGSPASVPAQGLSTRTAIPGLGGVDSAFGDLDIFFKYVLWQNLAPPVSDVGGPFSYPALFTGQRDGGLVSTGMTIRTPTGPSRFADSPSTGVRDTAAAIDLLAGEPAAFAVRQKALAWLSPLTDASNIDTVARRMAAIAPQPAPADSTFLLGAQHPSGGWGLRAGDEFVSFRGQPLISIADFAWVLHRAPDAGNVDAMVKRGGKDVSLTFALPSGWRAKSDISRRVGTWSMRAMAFGGMTLVDLDDAARRICGGEYQFAPVVAQRFLRRQGFVRPGADHRLLACNRRVKRRGAGDPTMRLAVRPVLGPLLLAAPVALVLALRPDWQGWIGIQVPAFGLIPNLSAVVGYGWAFFIGWSLERQRTLLPEIEWCDFHK